MKIQELFDVSGRTVVVTGGASGIGLGIARALGDNGAHVVVADIDPAALERVRPALGAEARTVCLDITDRAAVDAAFDEIRGAAGRIDAVFANAGVGGNPGFGLPDGTVNPAGTIDGLSDEEWRTVLATNLDGTRNTLAAAARTMKADAAGGRIIVTSSAAAIINVPFVSTAYHAAKAAIAHLTRQAAIELAPHRILVNSIAPANFVTNIGGGSMNDEAVKAVFARTSLLGRTAEIEEIAGLALFLASDASSYVTGADFRIDGGASLVGPR